MLNPFVIKKYVALLVCGFLPILGYAIGLMYWKFIGALLVGLGCLLLSIILSVLLLKDPFRIMVEGKGLLVLDLNSTGIIQPFIMKVHQPYVEGKIFGEKVNDVYDRDTVVQLAEPIQSGNAHITKEGIDIKLTQDEFNKLRFGLYHYPTLIYNGQIKSLITKDFLSEQEKKSFAEHGILYLNRKMEELTSIVRDFGRYIVELTKPKSSIFQSKWFWIILIVGIGLIAILMGKPILEQIMGKGSETLSNTLGNNPVVPR